MKELFYTLIDNGYDYRDFAVQAALFCLFGLVLCVCLGVSGVMDVLPAVTGSVGFFTVVALLVGFIVATK